MSRGLRVESLGRMPSEGMHSRNDDETDRTSPAETWILSGGAWKKRREAAAARNSRPNSPAAAVVSPTNSPFRNRAVGTPQKQQRPRSTGRIPVENYLNSSTSDSASTPTVRNTAKAQEMDSFFGRSSSRISVGSSKASSVETSKKSVKSSQTEPIKSTTPKAAERNGNLQRSGSSLSRSSTIDTRRTAQTEPQNTQVDRVSPTSVHIPRVVVEEKKKDKQPRPSDGWLREKDDFFSAMRHSDSVSRQGSISPQSEFSARPGISPRPMSAPREKRVVTPNRKLFERSNSWNDEKKESSEPGTSERPRPISPGTPVQEISLRSKQTRNQRARSVTPKGRRSGIAPKGSPEKHDAHPAPVKQVKSLQLPQKKRSPTPEEKRNPSPVPKKDIVSSKESLLSEEEDALDAEVAAYSEGLPMAHVTAIRQSFGLDCDIYRDVLRVGRNATERQLRIAYFRRGRNILSDHQKLLQASKETGSKKILKGLSKETKARFQAVNLAYEIINRPQWRALYDERGWNAPLVDVSPSKSSPFLENDRLICKTPPPDTQSEMEEKTSTTSGSRSRPTTPILRPSVGSPDERRSRSTGRGIRWSEQVEEMVFRQDPEEILARRVRSPSPELLDYEDDQPAEDFDGMHTSFMANLLSDLDQSLDGLEASIDGIMRVRFDNWSLSSKGSTEDKKKAYSDRQLNISPATTDTDESHSMSVTDDENDTVPSKFTNEEANTVSSNQGPPPGWNGGESVSVAMPSTIVSEDDTEDSTIQQLFSALTQTKKDRSSRPSVSSTNLKTKESDADYPSSDDVEKVPTPKDDVDRAFKDFDETRVAAKSKSVSSEFFNPFEDSASTLNIGDSEFSSPPPGQQEDEERKDNEERPDSHIHSSGINPEDIVRPPSQNSVKFHALVPPSKAHLFSNNLPEFDESLLDFDTTSLRRAHSEFSSLTGTISDINGSVKTDMFITTTNMCSPVTKKEDPPVQIEPVTIEINHARMMETPEEPPQPCETDFLSQFFCYPHALSADFSMFGNQVSSAKKSWMEETNKALAATQVMILESLTFTEENVEGMVNAIDVPGIERSSTM